MNQFLRTYVLPALMPLLAGFGGCLAGAGCALWTPGASVRRGLEQSKLYEWRENGSFWTEGKGTQEEQFTMAQGSIVLKEDADGNSVIDLEESTLTYYLTAKPSAKVAGTAMERAFQAGTEQAKMLTGMVSELVAAIVPLIPVPGPAPTEVVPQ